MGVMGNMVSGRGKQTQASTAQHIQSSACEQR